jgi:hypothetical protein
MGQTSNAKDPMPQPPERPGDDECCESGCDRCIWIAYSEARNRYRVELAAWQQRQRERLT